VTAEQGWLTTLWPTVRAYLPSPPATVVEIGCGRDGGFVPRLRDCGYDAVGIDPAAPDEGAYVRLEFERSELRGPVEAVVACTSLHHVDEPDVVLEKIRTALVPDGTLMVVEWDWESFDETTARWCFERLGPTEVDSWLGRHRTRWAASGLAWDAYLRGWAYQHRIHSATRLGSALNQRFRRIRCDRGAYLFADLVGTSEADELDAISRGHVHALRVDYVGRPLAS
jgi:SAM-dependent methyltransferase